MADDDIKKPEDQEGSGNDSGVKTGSQEDATVFDELTSLQDVEDMNLGGQMQGKENAEGGAVYQEDMGYMASVHQGGFSTEQDVIEGILPEEDDAFKSDEGIYIDDEDTLRDLGDNEDGPRERRELGQRREEEQEEGVREQRERAEAPELAPANPDAIDGSVDTLDVFAAPIEDDLIAEEEEATPVEEEEIIEEEPLVLPKDFLESLIGQDTDDPNGQPGPEKPIIIREEDIIKAIGPFDDIDIDAFYQNTDSYLGDGSNGTEDAAQTLAAGIKEGNEEGDGRIVLEYDDNGLRIWKIYTGFEQQDSDIGLNVTITRNGQTASASDSFSWDVDNTLADDNAALDWNQTVNIDVLGNDTLYDNNIDFANGAKADAGVITKINGQDAEVGKPIDLIVDGTKVATLTLNSNGTIKYDPEIREEASYSFEYEVTDDNGETKTASVTVDVDGNAAPDVRATHLPGGTEYQEYTLTKEQLLANATDADGDALSITSVTGRDDVTIVDNGDGTWTITSDEEGLEAITFTVSDGIEETTQTTTINFADVDNTATDDAATLAEDGTKTINVLSNDQIRDGGVLSDVSQPENGEVTFESDGTVTYKPNPDFHGTETFTYTLTDEDGETVTATVTMTVTPENDIPVLNAIHLPDGTEYQEYTVTKEQLLAAASDVDGDALSITGVSGSSHLAVTDNGNGTWTIISDEEGLEAITFTVSDGTAEVTQTTAIKFADVDNAATDDSATLAEDGSKTINVMSNDDIKDGGILSGVTQPENGTVAFSGNGTVTYTPHQDFNGTDTFTYTVTDEDGETVTATVTMTVTPENDAPVVGAISLPDGTEYQSYTVTKEQLLGNATDVDGDTLSVTGVSGGSNLAITDNGDGTWTIISDEEGSEDITFTVSDGTAEVTQTATIDFADVDNTANDDAASVGEDGSKTINVLSNDQIIDGGELTSVTQPANGVVAFNADGTVTYEPNDDFNGTDTFTYTVTDEDGETVTATVTMTVTPENDAPVVGAISLPDGTEYQSYTVTKEQLLGNATDVDGDTLSVTGVSGGSNLAITDNGDGTWTIISDEEGSEDITFTVSDGTAEVTQTATIDFADVDNTANDDAASVGEDGSKTINVLSNDQIIDGGELTSVTQPANGVVAFNADGTVTYEPNDDFNGTDTFTYTVTDEDGETVTATVTMTVTPENDAPVVGAISLPDGTEYQSYTVTKEQLLGNATDVDGDALTVTGVSGGSNLAITDNGDGTWTIISDEEGSEDITFTVSDGTAEVTQTATIDFADVDNTANDDAASVGEDGSKTINVLSNDQIIDGGELTSVTQPANGVVAFNADGTVTYEPNDDFNGTDTFTYTVTDEDGETVTATVTMTVTPENDAPVVGAISLPDGTEYQSYTVTKEQLLGNATDVDGDALTVTGVSGGSNLAITDNGDGTWTIISDEEGSEDITFTVSDGTAEVTQTATIDFADVDNTANDDAASVGEDGSKTINVLSNDQIIDGGELTSVTQPANGVVAFNADGTVTYEPNDDFNGTDTFTYTVTDEDGETVTATVTMTVTPENDAPVVGAISLPDGTEYQSYTVTKEQLLGNATDVDGDTLSVTGVSGGSNLAITDNGDGTWTIISDEEGSEDITFTVSDGTAEVTQTATIDFADVDNTANDDAASVGEDGSKTINVLSNDQIIDGGELTSVTQPANGVVAFNADGTVTYEPNDDFNGTDTFTYTVTDEDGETVTATVTMTVTPENDAPVVGAISLPDGTEYQSYTVTKEQLLGNATDVDGDTLSVTGVSGGSNLAITDNGDGTWTIISDEEGSEDITFTVSDGTAEVTQTATIDFADVDNTANDDAASVGEDGSKTINVLSNDQIIDGGELTSVTQPANGVVAFNADGTVTYEPNDDFNGTDTFTYTVTDEDGETVTATVTMTVTPENDAPVVGAISLPDGTEYQSYTVTKEQLLGNATDVDGDALTVTGVSGGSNLAITDNGDGTWTIISDEEGSEDITFTVSDGTAEVTQTATIDFADVDNTANDDAASVGEDGSKTINVLSNDQIIDGGELTSVTQPANGVVAFNADGTVTYEPNDDFNGTDTFTYTVTDEDGETVTATVTMTVTPENDAPVVGAISLPDGTEYQSYTVTKEQLLGNATDVDGDALTVTGVSGGSNLAITDNGDGTWTIISDEEGSEDITFTVSDGTAEVTQTATIDFADVDNTANDDAASVGEDGSKTINVLSNDQIIDGGELTSVTQPANGVVAFNADGTVTYEPNDDFNGTDTFTYTVTDEDGETVTATVTMTVTPENDAPVVGAISLPDGTEYQSYTVTKEQLLGNATDVDGDTLSVTGVSGGSNLAITDNGDGTWTIISDEEGSEDITFTVSDGTAEVTQTATIDFADVDNTANDDAASVGEDGSKTINVLSNDQIIDGGELTSVTQPANGVVAFNADGTVTYEPNDDFNGTDTFTYTVTDEDGETVTATVTMTVTPENDAPVVGAISLPDGTEYQSYTVTKEQLLGNATDVDGDALTVTGVSGGSNLAITDNGDGTWTIISDEEGSEDITFTVSDGTAEVTQTATIDFADVDNTANDDAASVGEDGSKTINVLSNDQIIDGGELTSVTQPANGVVAFNADGTVTYEPNDDFNGTDTFTYTVTDEDGETVTATVTMTVTPENDAPVVGAISLPDGTEYQSYTVTKEQLLGNATDVDGDALTVTGVSGGSNLAITDNGDGTWTIISDEEGSEDITFTVSDGTAEVTQTATIDFADVDNTANDDAASVGEDGSKTINVLSNDQIIDGGELTSVTQPANGVVAFNADGTVTYEPNDDFNGTDTFTYTVTDEDGETVTATVTMTVTPENDAPVVGAISLPDGTEYQSYTVTKEQLLGNATDVDGDALTVTGVSGGSNLAITDNGDGTWTIISDEEGSEDITFTVSDGTAEVTQTATIDFADVDNTANDDAASVGEDGSKTINVLSNDQIIDGGELTSVTQPANGVVAFNADGTVTYEPNDDFNGTDTFTYTVTDEDGETVTATVTMTVTPENDAPVVGAISLPDGTEYQSYTVTKEQLLGNATDVDGDTLSVTGVSGGSNLAITDNGDGTWTIISDEEGSEDITFTVSDGTAEVTQTATIDFADVDNTANDDAASVGEDGSKTINVLSNDQIIDGGELTSVTQPANGVVAFNADGTVTYEPNDDFNGTDTFTYTVTDEDGETVTATVTMTVTPENDAPVVGAISLPDGTEYQSYTVTKEQLLGNATDVDGDTLSVTGVSGGSNLAITDNGDGTWTIISDEEGSEDITFTVSDGTAEVTQTATIDFADVDNTANDDAASVGEDGSKTINVLSNDQIIDGGELTSVTQPANGVVAFNADGTVTYEPNDDFNGTDTFTYTVTDEDGETVTATVTMTVTPENDAPVVGAISLPDGTEYQSYTVTKEQLLGNATDVDGDALSVTGVSGGSNLAITDNGDGTWTIISDEEGSEDITFTVSDGTAEVTQTATIDFADVDNTANDDAASVGEDGSKTINVLSNDQIIDGGELTSVTQPANGVVAFNADGTVTYEPNDDFNGTDTFTYTVTDEDGETVTATVTMTVTPENDAPVVGAISLPDGTEYQSYTVTKEQLLGNATDVDGDALSVTGVSGGSNLAITDNGDGTWTIISDEEGSEDITFTVSDGTAEVTQTATIDFADVDNTANDDAASVGEDGSKTINVLSNDQIIDGGELTSVTQPANGVVAFNADGTVTYEPNDDFNGTDTFTYTVTDEDGETVTATVTMTVTPENDAPVVGAISLPDGTEYQSYTVTKEQLLGNATDVDGDTLSVTGVSGGSNLAITDNGDGTWTIISDEEGSEDITFTVSDGTAEVTQTATIDFADVDNTANDDAASVGEDGSKTINVLSNDQIIDGGELTSVTQPANGVVAFNADGTVTYEPNDDFNGTDTFTYTVTDEDGETVTATVTMTVTPENDAPVVGAISLPDGTEYQSYTVTKEQLLGNATDVDGDALTVTGVSGGSNLAITDNGDGTWTIISDEEGSEDITFTVSDGTAEVTQTATIDFADVDNTANDDAASVGEDGSKTINVLSNDQIIDGGELTSVTQPANGVVAFNADGTVTYEPNDDFNGTDTFTYTVTDEDGETVTATVTMTVTPENDAPVVGAISLPDGTEYQSYTVTKEQLLGNATDVDGDTLSVTGVSGGSNLAITDNGDGTWTIISDEEGSEDITFTVSDGTAEVTQTATIDFADVDNTANDDAASVGEDGSKTINVLSNDQIIDGGELTSVTQPANGVVAFNADGTVTYEPNDDFNGTDTFTYTVTDEDGETVTATVTMTVTPENDAPVVGAISLPDGTEYQSYTVTKEQLLGNATDVDGDTLSVTGVSGGSNLAITDNGDGTWTIISDEEGSEDITFTVSDGTAEVTQTATIDFADVDNTANDDAASVGEDGSKTINVLSNDQIIDGGELTSVTQPANGVVAFNADGTVTYEPNDDFNGTDTFTYTVTDEDGETVTATVTMTVNPENDDPIAVNDITVTEEDKAVTIDLLDNDSDIDGDSLSITQVDGQDIATGQTITLSDGSGTVTLNENGTVSFDPTDDLNGEVNFSYTISDGHGGTDTATATVTIDAVNDGPVAVDDSFSGDEDTTITFSATELLGNDSDVDSTGLSIAQINGVSLDNFPAEGMDLGNGTLTFNSADNTFSFAPTEDWSGTETLSYTVTDGDGGSAQANIALNVDGVADTPDLAVSLVESGHTGDSVTVTFQDTNAGYHNTYGYYILDENGEPSTGQIIFADLHDQSQGDSFVLDGVDQDRVGFFLLSDGDGENSGLSNGMDVTFQQDAAGNWQVVADGNVLEHDNNGGLYFSNEEFNADNLDHSFDDSNVIGTQNWEDQASQYGGNDFDFDDASFNVEWDTSNSETTYDVNISAAITDDDLSESLTVTIEDFPEGATFNMGEIVNGKLVISGDDLNRLEDLTMTVTGDVADFQINVTATATEPNGSTASTSLTVSSSFDPDAIDDTGSVTEGQSITMDVVANDVAGDSESLNIVEINGQSVEAGDSVNVNHGTVTLNEDGSITFAADNGYEGPADFTYTVSDGQGTDTATVNLDITDGNIAPVAGDDTASTNEDTSVVIDLLDNDSDANNDALSITQIDGQDVNVGETITLSDGSGQVTLNNDGTVTFDPSDNLNGDVSFDYTIRDPEGMSDTATVTVDIDAVNDGPVAGADNAQTLEDNAVTFNPLGNDSDVDGDSLSITQINGQNIEAGGSVELDNGTLTLNEDGTVTFNPDQHYAGTQDFTYTVSDGQGGVTTATASVDVEADADAPVISINIGAPEAVSDDGAVAGGSVSGDDVASGSVQGVTISGFDSEGNPAAVEQVTNGHGGGIGVAAHTTGSKDLLGYDSKEGASESLVFEFDEDVNNVSFNVEQFGEGGNGANASFEQGIWEAYDNGELVASGTFDGRGLNNADDTASVSINGVTFDKLVVKADTTINADGSTAAGDSDFAIDNLEFTYADASGEVAYYDYPLDVSAELVDQDGSESLSAVTLSGLPEGAVLTQNGVEITITDGSATVSVDNLDGLSLRVPADAEDFSIDASVTSTDSNGDQATSTASDTAEVPDIDINNGPDAVADSLSGVEDQPITFNTTDLLGNDTDVDGDSLSIVSFDQPEFGTITDDGNGTFTFTPNENWNGQTDFTYTISDGQGGTDTATVSITVDGVNDGPVATHDEADTLEDNAVTFNPLGNDSDIEGDSLSITQINGEDIEVGGSVDVGNGSVTLNVDGTVTFNPDGDYAGSQSFEYTVSDGQGGTSTGTANVDVEADADVPDLSVSVGEGVTQTTGGEPVDVTINSENATSTGGGFTVTARTVDENGNLEDTDIAYNNNPVGFGVAGASSGASSEIGYDNTHQASEELIFDFNNDVSSVDVSVAWLHGGEDAIYTMYKDGVEVGRGMIDGGSDRVDPAITLTADGGVDFDQIVFSAEGSGDDYLIHSLEFEVSDGGETTTTYPLNITSGLNDTDGSESLSLSVDGLPDGAVLSAGTQNEDGSWTLSAGDLEGLTITVPSTGEDFTVEVSATATESSNGDFETITASANVVANQAPVAENDSGATTEDHSVVLDLKANDSDANNDELSVTQINGQDIEVGGSVDVGNGSVTLNEDGTVTFNPDGDFAGTQDFTYTVSDGQGETSTATASVDIEAVADMPELNLEIGEGNTVTLGASEGESSTIFTTTFGQTDGGFYTSPVDGWNTSSDAIEVWDTDGDGSYIELNDDNRDHYQDATSINRTVDTVEDASYTVDFDYSGRAGYDETVNAIEVRVNGVTVAEFNHDNANGNDNDWQDGSFTFTGTGEPMTIEFVSVGEAIDYGRGMYLDNIEAVQTLPDNPGEEFIEYPLNLSAHTTDVDGSESLSAVTLSGLPEGAVILVDGQEVTVSNGTASIASNNLDDVVLRVPADQTDFDLSASVTSTESSNDDSATATVTASVNTNSEPVLSDDSAVTNEDTSVVLDLVANDNDADNDTLTITHINGEEISVGGQVDVGNGTVTLEADGTVTFTPKGDYAGAQSFEYTVSDGEGHSATATADIDVEAVADAPELTVNLGEGQLVGGESSGGAGDSTGGGSASYDNTITGTTDNDYNIVGTNDDDYIDASHGNDRVYAGHGDDYIDGNTGDDVLYADKGDDTVIGGHGNDYLSGDQGDDYLDGGTGHDRIYGGSGDDTIIGDHGNDTLFGGSGDDTISAGTGNDYVSGEDGDDIIDTDSGNDVIYGGSGDDTITAGMGNDYINGQGGNDTLVLSGNSSEYAINAYGGGYLVTHYGSDGTDYIEGVEELQFADGTIDVTDFANGGSVSDSSGGGDSTGGGSSGDAYMEYPLDITVDETDVDGSETLSAVTLSGLPDGAVLLLDGQAVSITNGTATLSSDDLDNLTLRVPSDAGSFELTASVTSTDGDDSATTTVNTAVGNDAPVANNDYATTNEDTAIVLDLVDNDTDTGSDSLSITQIDGVDISIGDTVNVGNGTVTLNADGSINFMPSDDFSGEVSFDYTVSDSQGASDTATASIDVTGVADGAEVSVNIGEGSVQNGAVQSGTISPSNWDDTNDGISVTGYTYDSSGGWHSSADNIQETHGGLGVADSSGGKEITDGENITFTFDNDLSQATVNLSGLKSQEQADYTLLDDNGHVVGSGTIYGSGNGEISATLTGNSEFSQIVITGEHKTNNYCKTSKFVIDSVDYTPVAAAAVMAYPVTFALSMNDASESLLGDELSVDLSTIPHGSELSIGDATVSVDQNGSISVTSGDDVSVDGSTLKIPSATLGEDLSVSGTVTVPVDENGHHDSFDLTASVQTIDGTDVSIENIDADVAGTHSDEIGTDGNDILYADDNGAQLAGGDGNDILVDGDGDDVMIGGDGNDTFYVSDGEDVMSGGDGNDLFIFSGSADSGTSGQDWVDGGADFDTIHLNGSEGWTLTITNDDGSQDVISSDSASAEQMADYQNTSGLTGQIEFDDGSTVIFEGVEKVEW